MRKGLLAGLILLNGIFVFGQAGTGYIQDLAGTVELKAPGTAVWSAAQRGARIYKDTAISTGFKSTALIVVGNSTILVRALSRMTLADLQSSQGNEEVLLDLQAGRIRTEVRPPVGNRTSFVVRGPTATASVRGTSFDFDGVNLSVDEGSVHVTGGDGLGVYVGAGHGSISDPQTGRTTGPADLFWAELTLGSPAAARRTGAETAEGTVTIQFGPGSGWARTSFTPELISGFHYQLEFRRPGSQLISRSVPQGTRNINLKLPQGNWTVTARAYDSGNVLRAAGRTTAAVTTGNTALSITMGASNVNLGGLTVSAGLLSLSPSFTPDQTNYTMGGILAFSSSINITAVTSDPNASITINGEPVPSGTTKTVSDLSMFGGTVTIQIVVTAQDGISTKTYTITANRNFL
jgi:hypothetical protein